MRPWIVKIVLVENIVKQRYPYMQGLSKWTYNSYDNSSPDNHVASTDCKVCSSGTYQDQPGQNVCKDCPAGTVRVADTMTMIHGLEIQ